MPYKFNSFSGSLDTVGAGVPDAPSDGNFYDRKNGQWVRPEGKDITNFPTNFADATFLLDSSGRANMIVGDIGSTAFSNRTDLTNLYLGRSCTSIGDSAFNYCTGFTGSLTIPNSVTTIGSYAFYYCTGFTNVNCYITKTIIDSATNIFLNTGITTIHARSTDATWTAGAGQDISGATVEVFKDL